MSDIDFLANNKREDDQPAKSGKKEEIIWSEPEDGRPIPKEAAFSALSALKDRLAAKAPAPAPKPADDRINREKINASRQEILKSIKRGQKPAARDGAEKHKSFLAGLFEKMKKQPSHKEIFINYQQAVTREKSQKWQSGGLARPADSGPVKQIFNNQPIKQVKAAEPKAKKAFKESWFSRLLKLMKEKPSTSDRPGPARINSAETAKAPTPVPAPPPQAKPAAAETRPVKVAAPLPAPDQTEIKAPKVIETNLIKGEIITFFDWDKKIITLLSAILVPAVLVGLIYFGLGYYQKYSQDKIREQTIINNGLTERIGLEELSLKEINEFRARLKIVSQIFAQHIYWTNFFKFLEDNTIEDVYFSGFFGDTSGSYPLEAVALRFSNISEQINVFRNNSKVTAVTTAGGEASADKLDNSTKVNFDLNLSVSKSIFTE